MSVGDALNVLGDELVNDKNDRKHLEEVLDRLLGEDEESYEDEEFAAEWERVRRE